MRRRMLYSKATHDIINYQSTIYIKKMRRSMLRLYVYDRTLCQPVIFISY